MAATSRFSAARPRLPAAAAEVQAVHRTNHTRNCTFPAPRPHSRSRSASPSARNNLSYEQMDTMYHRPAHMPAEPSPVCNLEAARGRQRMSKLYSQPAGGRRHHFLHLTQNAWSDSLQRLCAVCFHPPGQVFKEHSVIQLRPLCIIEQVHIIALARTKRRQCQLGLLVRFRRSDIYTVLRVQFLEVCSRNLDVIRTGACKESDNRWVFKRFSFWQFS